MSGPSAMENPMSAKIAVSSSVVCVIGCTGPISNGASRTGSVTSTLSVLRRSLRAALLNVSRRAASAALTRSLRPLISGPCVLRSSGASVPSVLSNAVIAPFLPSAATRTVSSAGSSPAAATSARIFCSSCAVSGMAVSRRSIRHERQVGIARPAARLGEHRMHLAAMMGLMIEHVGDKNPARPRPFALGGPRIVGLIGGKPGVIDAVGPVENFPVERRALGLQGLPFRENRHRIRNADRRPRQVGEAGHPALVAPQDVVERLVDRAEPRATLLAALRIRQRIGDAVQIFVLPAIIARHALHVGSVNHDTVPMPIMPGMTEMLRECRLGLSDDRLERRRFGDGQVRQYLAVDGDAGLGEPGDKSAVVEPERTHRRVEPLNPQRAECALANLAIAEGVLLRFFHGLLGDADRVLAPAVIALGGLVDLLVLGMGGDAAFDASHD